MKATLEEELDKVERGFIKLEEDWVSPQEKAQFPELVRSRIGLLRMQRIAKGGNHYSIISAMREFENIEENYYGTPAFPRAVELAKQLLPNLGAQLQRMSRDVDYRNAEFERTKAQMDEVARQGIDAARAREEAQYQAGLAADKKAGIRWVRLNARSKASIDGYFKMASDEMKSLNTFDIEGLKKQSGALKEVDELIAKNNFLLAESKLEDAAKIPTRINADPKKKYSKKGSKGSYLSTLKTKLNQQKAKQEELAKAQEEAAKSQALSKNMKSDKSEKKDAAEGEDLEAAASDQDKQRAAEEALEALAASAPKKKEEEKSSKSKTKSKKSSKRDEDADEKEEKRERVRPSGGGGGISITRIIQIGTVLLLIAVVAFKYLGIGGNKE
jgi:DNA polymerase III gamma/tau subunit